MGKKSEKLPKENIRASSEEFLGAARCSGPSIGTNGQEPSKMFQRKIFHALLKNLNVRAILGVE